MTQCYVKKEKDVTEVLQWYFQWELKEHESRHAFKRGEINYEQHKKDLEYLKAKKETTPCRRCNKGCREFFAMEKSTAIRYKGATKKQILDMCLAFYILYSRKAEDAMRERFNFSQDSEIKVPVDLIPYRFQVYGGQDTFPFYLDSHALGRQFKYFSDVVTEEEVEEAFKEWLEYIKAGEITAKEKEQRPANPYGMDMTGFGEYYED
jgi:hypothetical protein